MSRLVQQARHGERPRLRVSRGLTAMRLAARGGARYAANAPRLFAAAGEQRQQLRDDLALRTAQDVADTLGTMKGVLMKIGQLASYVDDGIAPPARRILGRLQDSVPPMSPELAASVIVAELGAAPERVFREWDPLPIAAASIGQVHRAITADGRAVAVKVQYPGIAEAISADLGNVALIRSLLKMAAPSQDVTSLIEELRERIGEELDYVREAENQRLFAAFFDGHPTASVPKIVDELSTARVITSELAAGARFAEMLTWPQEERDLAAETIYRFTFRSLYELCAFNGDPHPGNYLFEPGGRVTFLDFGLVKHFTPGELDPLIQMIEALCLRDDPEGFRRAMEEAGFLQAGRADRHRGGDQAHVAVLRDGPRARPADDDQRVLLGGRPAVRGLQEPARGLRQHPPFLRDRAADQPGAVLRPRRDERDRRLAPHLGGDLAVRAGTAVHAARRGGSAVARVPVRLAPWSASSPWSAGPVVSWPRGQLALRRER